MNERMYLYTSGQGNLLRKYLLGEIYPKDIDCHIAHYHYLLSLREQNRNIHGKRTKHCTEAILSGSFSMKMLLFILPNDEKHNDVSSQGNEYPILIMGEAMVL